MSTRASEVVVTVCDEWRSAKGGISTFNREFSRAAVAAGYEVICCIPDVTEQDRKLAQADRVLLANPYELHSKLGDRPTIVIGHGRITGKEAERIAATRQNARRIHLFHMSPEAIEHQKDKLTQEAMRDARTKLDAEVQLGATATLATAVGARLARDFEPSLRVRGARVHTFLPGLFESLAKQQQLPVPTAKHCLLLGRADDHRVKGFDIALRAIAKIPARAAGDELVAILRGVEAGSAEKIIVELKKSIRAPHLDLRPRPFTADEAEISNDLRAASLVLMPSREEGFGLVGLEAISAGTPVLVTSRSGLAEMLEELVPDKAAHIVVRTGLGDKQDIHQWQEAIELVFRDLPAAYQRAEALRVALQSRLSWTNSVRQLLENLPRADSHTTVAFHGSTPAQTPNFGATIAAAAHMSGLLDGATSDSVADMVNAIARNVPDKSPSGIDVAIDSAIQNQVVVAQKDDRDLLIQVSIAIAGIRAKYDMLGIDLHAERKRVHELGRRSTEQSAKLMRLGNMVAKDLAAIPSVALAFVNARINFAHSAVLEGFSAQIVSWACDHIEKIAPDQYALENLERIMDAADTLLRWDARTFRLGYSDAGRAPEANFASLDLVAITCHEDSSSPSIVVVPVDSEARIAGIFVAREEQLDPPRFVTGPRGIHVVSADERFVYMWSIAAATPIVEWSAPGAQNSSVGAWVYADTGVDNVLIESTSGHGVFLRGGRPVCTWQAPHGVECLLWFNEDSSDFFRAYIDMDAGTKSFVSIFAGSATLPSAVSVDIRADVEAALLSQSGHLAFNRAFWCGLATYQGSLSILVLIGLHPIGTAVVILDAITLRRVGPVVVIGVHVEEACLASAGESTLLVATLMRGAGASLEAWDVSNAAGALAIGRFHHDPRGGWSLAPLVRDGHVDIYFAVRPADHGPSEHYELWSWRWPEGTVGKIMQLPHGVISAMAAIRRQTA